LQSLVLVLFIEVSFYRSFKGIGGLTVRYAMTTDGESVDVDEAYCVVRCCPTVPAHCSARPCRKSSSASPASRLATEL